MCKKEENAHLVNKVLILGFPVEQFMPVLQFFTLDINLLLDGLIKTQNQLAHFLIFKDSTAHRTMPSTHSANMGRNIYLLPLHICSPFSLGQRAYPPTDLEIHNLWLFTCVQTSVLLNMGELFEPSVAVGAFVRLFTSVNPEQEHC